VCDCGGGGAAAAAARRLRLARSRTLSLAGAHAAATRPRSARQVIKDCTKAIELDQSNANYYNCRGNAYFSLGKFSKAADDFSRAIELSPEASHGRYYNNRGSAYRRLKMFKEAIEDYSAAIAVDPKNGNYYNNRGNTYFDMGEFQLAIDDFTAALGMEPYSPKTKVTLAQAHEALAQEKRMKNATQYTGHFSSVKIDDGKAKRKDREQAGIYVSPAGVEVTYTHGWNKRKTQQSFAWSEDMKIELLDEHSVKLVLDSTGQTYVVITNCDATAVEEELIGRITTKFASYSTACLVAQHEAVVTEYTDMMAQIRAATEQLTQLRTACDEARKQQDRFKKEDKFDAAKQAKAAVDRLEEQIKDKTKFIDSERQRAEQVRAKAEQESGPVLDMVLIMQNRVRELYNSRVKGAQKYKVEDLELENQVKKMDRLVQHARDLQQVVARSVDEIAKAMGHLSLEEFQEDAEDADFTDMLEGFDPEEAKLPKGASQPVLNAPRPAAAGGGAGSGSGSKRKADDADDSDDETWDLEDESRSGHALPDAFATKGAEVFMQVESANGMVTITPSASGTIELPGPAISGVRKLSMITIPYANKKKEQEGAAAATAAAAAGAGATMDPEESKRRDAEAMRLKQEKDTAVEQLAATTQNLLAIKKEMEDLRRREDEARAALQAKKGVDDAKEKADLAKMQSEMEALKRKANDADRLGREKDAIMQNLQQTTEALAAMKAEAERVKAELAERTKAMDSSTASLSANLKMTAKEKADLEAKAEAQRRDVEKLRGELERQNAELSAAAQDALEKAQRLQALQEQEERMAETIKSLQTQTEEEKARTRAVREQLEAKLQSLESTSRNYLQDLESAKEEKVQLAKQLEEQHASMSAMRKRLQEMEEQLRKSNEEARVKAETLARAEEESRRKEAMLQATREQAAAEARAKEHALATAEAEKRRLAEEAKRKEEQLKAAAEAERKKREEELAEKDRILLQKEREFKQKQMEDEMKRRQLHNLIVDLKGNIRVYVRIRPALKGQMNRQMYRSVPAETGDGILVEGEEEEVVSGSGTRIKTWEFEFDRVFFPDATQKDVFDEISMLVQSALDGFRVSIFAYGQTGSGKTYTMEGPSGADEKTRGMIPRAVEQIFQHAKAMSEKGWSYKYVASFLEIYRDDIRDLLGSGKVGEHEIKMVKKGEANAIEVTNLTLVPVDSPQALLPLLQKAASNRTSAATQSNERSSRSHSVFQLRIYGKHEELQRESYGLLNLIDLAGSERVDKSKVTGERLEETKSINSSLTSLGDVIAALAQNAKHVPFRNSKLTYLLQDSFGGGCKTLMFINLASEPENLSESLCSLRFGNKVFDCHVGVAKKQVRAAPPKQETKQVQPKK
jgi:kinesin family protein C1